MGRLSGLTRRYSLCHVRLHACIFPLTVMVFLLCSFTAEAGKDVKRPIVIITVDVETTRLGSHVVGLPEQVDAVCTGNISCGLQEMVRILKTKGFAATFFLDVYEYKEYGEPSLQAIAKWFGKSGQDVELHTHPQWAFDEKRNMMFQYTLAEQTEIIRAGKELLHKWTGDPVIAHRAGSYSADENTVKALIANDILYDSSLFFGNSNSRIAALIPRKNALSMFGPLYEFPVTVYRRNELSPCAGGYLPPHSVVRKYDINWFRNQEEAEIALKEAIKSKMDFVILFLHSFSFIKGENGAGQLVADADAIKRFGKVLDFIGSRGLKTLTFRQLHDGDAELHRYLKKPDIIPVIAVRVNILRYLHGFINRNDHKGLAVFCGVLAVLAVVSGGLLKRHTFLNPKYRKVDRDAQ